MVIINSEILSNFFRGLTNLQLIALDINPLVPWSILNNVQNVSSLVNFIAINVGVLGLILAFFDDTIASLHTLWLSTISLAPYERHSRNLILRFSGLVINWVLSFLAPSRFSRG